MTPARRTLPPQVQPSPSPNHPAKRTCLAPGPQDLVLHLKEPMTGTGWPPHPCSPTSRIQHPSMLTPRPGLVSAGITAGCDERELPQGGAPGPAAASLVSLSPLQHPPGLHTPRPACRSHKSQFTRVALVGEGAAPLMTAPQPDFSCCTVINF